MRISPLKVLGGCLLGGSLLKGSLMKIFFTCNEDLLSRDSFERRIHKPFSMRFFVQEVFGIRDSELVRLKFQKKKCCSLTPLG